MFPHPQALKRQAEKSIVKMCANIIEFQLVSVYTYREINEK
jgi:hypothetical protein